MFLFGCCFILFFQIVNWLLFKLNLNIFYSVGQSHKISSEFNHQKQASKVERRVGIHYHNCNLVDCVLLILESLRNRRSCITNGFFFQQNFSFKTKKMNNYKSQECRHTSKTPFSFCTTDITNSVSTFYRRHQLLQCQHLSVKFTADSLIRHVIISPGIF